MLPTLKPTNADLSASIVQFHSRAKHARCHPLNGLSFGCPEWEELGLWEEFKLAGTYFFSMLTRFQIRREPSGSEDVICKTIAKADCSCTSLARGGINQNLPLFHHTR